MGATRTQQLAVAWLFFALGWGGGNWLACIAPLREGLGLSHQALGSILLAGAVGAMGAFILSPHLRRYVRVPTLTLASAYAYFLSLASTGQAASAWWLAATLVLMGASSGLLNMLMNSMAVAMEQRMARPHMGRLHGICSLGCLVGAACGAAVIGLQVGTAMHLAGVASVLALVTFACQSTLRTCHALERTRPTQDRGGDEGRAGSRFRRRRPPPLNAMGLLGTMTFCAAVCEGAMADWTGVYMRERLRVSLAAAGRGYMVFALAMVTSRLCTDWATRRWGQRQLVCGSACLAAAGICVALWSCSVGTMQVGLAAVGAGLASTVPILYREVTRQNRADADRALARVAQASYAGGLVGPPLIGLLADAVTLRGALSVLGGLSLVNAACATRLDRAPAAAHDP